MAFFSSSINVLQILVVAIGAGLGCLGRRESDGRVRRGQSSGEITRNQATDERRWGHSDRNPADSSA